MLSIKSLLRIGFLVLLLCTSISYSQTKIFGTVQDSIGPLYSVSVVLKDSSSTRILAYTYSNKMGGFSLNTNRMGGVNLVLSYLGFETKTIPLILSQGQTEQKRDVVLTEQPMDLDEVIIKAEKAIVVRKDTIAYKTKYFTDGTENTVEDLLQKIPGLNIDSEGTIKIGNQEIEKLMIDGDDFFERGYKILSKNMPAYPIEEVEILKRYSNNRLLKDIEESNKVALNLKLNEKAKRIWFGNTELAYGNDNFYQFKINLMNFGKKNKFYFLVNGNSTGYDATGDINQLIRPFRPDEPGSIGDNQSVQNLLNMSAGTLNFKSSRTNFNNLELLSLNAIFNPIEKLKIKPMGLFNSNEIDFFKRSLDEVDVNGTNFTNTEDYQLRNKSRIAFGKLDITYNISKTKMLEATTKYNNADFNDGSNLIFNGNSTIESSQHQNKLFDQRINYTNRIRDNKVLLLTARYIDEESPQNYSLNQFFYQDLFPEINNANNVVQTSTMEMMYAGINAHLIDRKSNGDLLELQLGNAYRVDQLSSRFSILNNDLLIEQPEGYQNLTTYSVNDIYLKSKYRKKIGKMAFTANLQFHQLFNTLESNGLSKRQNPFFINPSLGFTWQINKKNLLMSSYIFNTTNAEVLDVYSDFVLTGFRSFAQGTGNFNQLDASAAMFNYRFDNYSGRFSAGAFVRYSKNHDFFSTNTIINQNFTQSEKILIKDREVISIDSDFDYYFKVISSNLKLKFGFSQFDYKNIVNASDFRTVTSNNFKYSLQLRSGFSGIFNYNIGTEWLYNEIKTSVNNSFTDNISFVDLSFVFNKSIDLQIQTERYFFGNLQRENTYYFLDFEARYKLIDNKLTLGITGKNLFNTKRFKSFSISDIGSSTTEYRLLPRFVLLKLEYRF
jgi:hypothetical protein